jgi:hypothetical protein
MFSLHPELALEISALFGFTDKHYVMAHVWRYQPGRAGADAPFEACEIDECEAVSVYAEGGQPGLAVVMQGDASAFLRWLEQGEQGDLLPGIIANPEMVKFSEAQARVISRYLSRRYGFSGHLTLSTTAKTWNIWRKSGSPDRGPRNWDEYMRDMDPNWDRFPDDL